MDPLITFSLFIANILALALSLSVLILAYAQHPGDLRGRAVLEFLAALTFYNFAVILLLGASALNAAPPIAKIVINLNISGFALCTIGAFSLIISLAGMMKQAFQVVARAGMVFFLLIQWPLWTDKFFTSDLSRQLMLDYAPAGFVSAAFGMIYIVMTLSAAWVYRSRIDPMITLGIVVLMVGQILAIINPILREYGFASIMSVAASAILGYRLARMQLFNPLRMQMAQLAALRDVSHALIDTQDVQQVLDAVVQQSRRMLNTDLALITIRDENAAEPMLVVGAQDGGSINVVGRRLAPGSGMSGRAYVTKQTLRVHNYHAWEGQSPTFADLPVHATLSVPLLYDEEVIGVLTVSELKPGRIFSDREQAMLEMLVPQAAVALMNARLRQRIAALEHVSAG